MSITDELREYATTRISPNKGMLEAIADRIDAEHEAALLNVHTDLMDASGWVRLPKDADGEYIHIGDKVTCGASVWEVTGFRFTGGFWGICCTIFNDKGGSGTNVYPPSDLHHYHAPTVEDVLEELLREYDRDDSELTNGEIIEMYAQRLRLREVDE